MRAAERRVRGHHHLGSRPVELPDGARIKQLSFFGEDNSASDISIVLHRSQVAVPLLLGSPSRTDAVVNTFTTAGASGVVVASGADNLDEVTGSLPQSSFILSGSYHRFHQVEVTFTNGQDQVLCGIEVRYQVPASAADPGTVFHPIAPVRAFDSRVAAYAQSGVLVRNTSKVIDISDGHDAGGAITAAEIVPPGATAITYNITIAGPTGPNFMSVTPGDAASFTASTINFDGTSDLANAATVAIAGDRTIKVWGGDQSGSAHVIIDVTGYYAPANPFPNMAG